MTIIDFTAAADLFSTKSRKSRSSGISYKRFDDAAEAVRFAVEEEERFDGRGIRRLYDSADFPRKRMSCIAKPKHN